MEFVAFDENFNFRFFSIRQVQDSIILVIREESNQGSSDHSRASKGPAQIRFTLKYEARIVNNALILP